MDILYLVGALIMLLVLGYAYLLLLKANKEKGATKIIGQVLSGLLVLMLLLLIIFYKTGIVSFMSERPSMRTIQGMSGYTIGMMSDDPQALDEFINIFGLIYLTRD